jgi:predicted nucleic acid-binding protein
MNYILDCSFCAALFLPDEKSETIKESFLLISEEDQIYVPVLWWYEMGNVLTVATRRKRITPAEAIEINSLLGDLNISTDTKSGMDYTEKLLQFTGLYRLSAYDAAYLELALRKRGILGTLDKDLKTAGQQAGISTIG